MLYLGCTTKTSTNCGLTKRLVVVVVVKHVLTITGVIMRAAEAAVTAATTLMTVFILGI